MRKLLVTLMSATLLIVSSVPMVAAAANCPPPAHEAAMAKTMTDYHTHAYDPHQQNEHEHTVALNGDWQKDRIECGCGCHNSIDSLPQLLAPHMTSNAIPMQQQLCAAVSIQLDTALHARAVQVPLPPPQYLIFSQSNDSAHC